MTPNGFVMPQAIRKVLQRGGVEKLTEIPTPTLRDYSEIVTAYAMDLQAELNRREDDK